VDQLQALRYTNAPSARCSARFRARKAQRLLRWSEQNRRLTKLGRELGPEGILDDGWWHHRPVRNRGNTIEAGTRSARNIVAERVLGLPKGR
jgi:hypothetical protein